MRLKSLKTVNNPKLGNLYLDFTVNGNVQDTIIFAGDNGSGKTTILDYIFKFTKIKYLKNNLENVTFRIILNEKEIEFIRNNLLNIDNQGKDLVNCLQHLDLTKEYEVVINDKINEDSYVDRIKIFAIEGMQKVEIDNYRMIDCGRLCELLTSFYSQAMMSYNLNKISNVYNINIDYLVDLSNKKYVNFKKVEIDKVKLGKRLREARKSINYTQEKLASKLNTTHSVISSYESGKSTVSTLFIIEIAKITNKSLNWLLNKVQ